MVMIGKRFGRDWVVLSLDYERKSKSKRKKERKVT